MLSDGKVGVELLEDEKGVCDAYGAFEETAAGWNGRGRMVVNKAG